MTHPVRFGEYFGHLIDNHGKTLAHALSERLPAPSLHSDLGHDVRNPLQGGPTGAGARRNPVRPNQLEDLKRFLVRSGGMDQLKKVEVKNQAKAVLNQAFEVDLDQHLPAQKEPKFHAEEGMVRLSLPVTRYGIGAGAEFQPGWFVGTREIHLTPVVAKMLEKAVKSSVKAEGE